MAMDNYVRIHFPIAPDEDGFPPVSTETVWAQPTDRAGEFVVANVPFFARNATIDDRVETLEADGVLRFVRVLQISTNSLIRVWLRHTTIDTREARLAESHRMLVALGCTCESMRQMPL